MSEVVEKIKQIPAEQIIYIPHTKEGVNSSKVESIALIKRKDVLSVLEGKIVVDKAKANESLEDTLDRLSEDIHDFLKNELKLKGSGYAKLVSPIVWKWYDREIRGRLAVVPKAKLEELASLLIRLKFDIIDSKKTNNFWRIDLWLETAQKKVAELTEVQK